jgi:hypothetical protein
VRLRRSDGQVTRPDAHGFVECLCGIPRLDGYPKGLKIVFQP